MPKTDLELLAELWEFRGFVPDASDLIASAKEARIFFSLPEIQFETESAKDAFIFHAAFYRGAAWMEHKLNTSRS